MFQQHTLFFYMHFFLSFIGFFTASTLHLLLLVLLTHFSNLMNWYRCPKYFPVRDLSVPLLHPPLAALWVAEPNELPQFGVDQALLPGLFTGPAGHSQPAQRTAQADQLHRPLETMQAHRVAARHRDRLQEYLRAHWAPSLLQRQRS